MNMRVAVYARYSSDLQKATSIEDQIDMARRFCSEQGFEIVRIFTDEEQTGRNTRREGFKALRASVEAREVDLDVVEAIDRLTRRVTDALSNWELFQFQGIGLHSITEGRQDFINVLLRSFGAHAFSEMIGKHTRRGLQGGAETRPVAFLRLRIPDDRRGGWRAEPQYRPGAGRHHSADL